MPERDNYTENARALFLGEDQEKLISKMNLKADEEFIYLRFMDMTLRIERKNGHIGKSSDGISYRDDGSHETAISVFDYLCRSKDDRRLSGKWTSLRGMGYSSHEYLFDGKGGLYETGGLKFSGNADKLERVCIKLGGKKMPSGDVGYVFSLFDDFPVYFQFWEGDDEFLPRAFVLWDSNTEQFIRFETAFYILSMLLQRLYELFDEE